jgi:hypothetical protein
MRALHMFPPSKKLKEIIADVDVDGDGVISFDEFVRMRRSNQATELNVLAQFKKFDCSSLVCNASPNKCLFMYGAVRMLTFRLLYVCLVSRVHNGGVLAKSTHGGGIFWVSFGSLRCKLYEFGYEW